MIRSNILMIGIACFSGSLISIADAATDSPPSVKEGNRMYRVSSDSCRISLETNPQVGGRITRLSFDGQDIIWRYTCDWAQYMPFSSCNGSGSTFWTSPQRAWPNGGWPPIVAHDGGAFSAKADKGHLLLQGETDEASGTSIDKAISIDEQHCSFNLQYTIHATRELKTAPWEITRVSRGGLAIFPLGDKNKLADAPLQPFVKIMNDDIAWFDDTQREAKPSKGGEKLIADGREGWLAYAHNNKLFIKVFADVAKESFAPNEGDIEIYADKEFLELEQQGEYTSIDAGSSLSWPVQWRIITIPQTIKVEAGSESLLKLIRSEVAKLR